MKTTDPEKQLELIKKVMKKESFELIFNTIEINIPPNEIQNLEKMFIKFLAMNPTSFRLFIESFEK